MKGRTRSPAARAAVSYLSGSASWRNGVAPLGAKTFEHVVAEAFPELYAGALFLCCGDARATESLLVDTCVAAAAEFDPQGSATRRSLDARLVHEFLRRPIASKRRDPDPASATVVDHLLGASAGVLPSARAAIWLVTFRRWSRSEAARELGVTNGALSSLLDAQAVLLPNDETCEAREG